MEFVDSASAPTIAQVELAMEQGNTAWAFYLAGPGAEHNWTPAQVNVLREGGMSFGLPIYVPRLDLSTNPAFDAAAFVAAMTNAGVYGVGVLDTEASMRGNKNLHSYVNGFVNELINLHVTPVVYGGGSYVPTNAYAWWIINGTPRPGVAYQWGQSSIGGVSVDHDKAGPGFPFATLSPPKPPNPPLPAPTSSPRGAYMLYTFSIQTDANGNGWSTTSIPWGNFMAISIEGSYPPVDGGYFSGTPHVQNRDGNVLPSITGCPANEVVSVFILATK